MTSYTPRQSSSEVATEADDVRAGLAQTLDQLRNNLRPENMVQEVVSNARIGAGNVADSLLDMARSNPIPALLIGAGCALIMGLGTRRAIGSGNVLDHESGGMMMPRPDRSRQRTSWRRSTKHHSDGVILGFGEPEPRPADGTQSVEDFGDATTVRAGRAPAAVDSTSSKVRDTMTSFGKSIPTSRAQLSGLLHEQPLILAALGVAVGAAIGAALPATETEDGWMGTASSSLRHAAQDVAQNEFDELRAVAGRTADNLKQSASDHGLSAENLNGLMRDAGDHAKSAIHDVGGSFDPAKTPT